MDASRKKEEGSTHRVKKTSEHRINPLELSSTLLVVALEVDVSKDDEDGGDNDWMERNQRGTSQKLR